MSLLAYKKVNLKYERLEEFEAGLELLGTEVKSLRAGQGSLDGSRVVIRGGEAYLVGATIPAWQVKNASETYDAERPRRLLLKKPQLIDLASAEAKKGLTIVPIEVYNKGRNIKLRIAIVRGKGKHDKREDLKKRDAERDAGRVLKR